LNFSSSGGYSDDYDSGATVESLYAPPILVDLENGFENQVSFFSVNIDVKIENKIFSSVDTPPTAQGISLERNVVSFGTTNVCRAIEFLNSENIGLGIPIPPASIALFQKQSAKALGLRSTGSVSLAHSEPDSLIVLRLSTYDNIICERKRLDCRIDRREHIILDTLQIKVTNNSEEEGDKEIVIEETLGRWHTWEMVEQSEPFEQHYHHKNRVLFRIVVPQGGERMVTYTVKYTGWWVPGEEVVEETPSGEKGAPGTTGNERQKESQAKKASLGSFFKSF